MAQRVQIVLEDDLDGGVAAETVTFGLDGVSYEIDLSDKNAGKLRDEFATLDRPCAPVGRPSHHGSPRLPAARPAPPSRRDLSAVRAWARANGHQVSDRGRVSAAVQEAYDKAH